jgi:hypothetical protein
VNFRGHTRRHSKIARIARQLSRVAGRTETSAHHEYRHMNDDENKPADKDAPRGMSDELVDGDTFDITDDPAKKEEAPLEDA